ncbi:MAG: hypothetical protein AMXMBFR64_62010 [Myxococcales bacterium]
MRRIRAGPIELGTGKCADLLVATPALARGQGGRKRRAGTAAAFRRSVLESRVGSAIARRQRSASSRAAMTAEEQARLLASVVEVKKLLAAFIDKLTADR